MLAFAALAVLIEITPGPNMVYLAALAMERGVRAGLAAVAGVALGLAILGSLAALGGAEIVARSPALAKAVSLLGVAYMVWLAFETWRGESVGLDGSRTSFRNGLVTNLLNAKAALFFVAVLPRFVDAAGGRSVVAQALTLVAMYVAIATLIHSAIVVMAAPARGVLEGAIGRRGLRAGFAALLLLVAAWMAWETL